MKNQVHPARDKVVIIKVTDLALMKRQIGQAIKTYSPTYGKTKEFSMYSHGALDGPVGGTTTSTDRVNNKDGKAQLTLQGWSKIDFNWSGEGNDRATFLGCRTGSTVDDDGKPVTAFTTKLSGLPNFKNVKVWGQTQRTWPSQYTDKRNTTWNQFQENYDNKDNTYMVGSDRGSITAGASVLGETKAYPMQESENGKTDAKNNQYQPGTTAPPDPHVEK